MVLPVVLLGLGGCGQTTTIDPAKVQNGLSGQAVTGSTTVASAKCPSGVVSKPATDFTCHVTLSDGTTGTWTVEIEDSKGTVNILADGFTKATKSGPSQVGASKVVSATGGIKLRVTLLSFAPKVDEPVPSGAIGDQMAGVTLRIDNIGSSEYRDHSLGYMSNGTDANGGLPASVNATGPCGGAFYQTPLRIPPGASAQGCVPFAVTGSTPVQSFSIEFNAGNVTWYL